MADDLTLRPVDLFPDWLPQQAGRYLEHTVLGRPIREIAREAGCHASTVLRQVRGIEAKREDPLVDASLARLTRRANDPVALGKTIDPAGFLQMTATALTALCRQGALLLFSAELAQPAIVQNDEHGNARVLDAPDLDIAAAMLLRGWMRASGGHAVRKYSATRDGRKALTQILASSESKAVGLREAKLPFAAAASRKAQTARPARQSTTGESPLVVLARRRDRDGNPFLTPEFVTAGERFQEDFVLSGLKPGQVLNWSRPEALDAIARRAERDGLPSKRAVLRVLAALQDLGPGLSDVAVRCCCLREGLEATEQRMGWSARSGKVVLRIALQRLVLHYDRSLNSEDALIG